MSKDLSLETHLKILNLLDQSSILQYQLVCKSWSKPATQKLVQHVEFDKADKALQFINMIIASPELRKSVKHVTIWPHAGLKESDHSVIRPFLQSTPFIESFIYTSHGSTYRTITEELGKGNLKWLNNVGFPDWYSVDPSDYVKTLSAMKRLPKSISFNLTSFREKRQEPFTLQTPLLAEKPDLLKEVKDLEFFTFSSTTIEALDDIIDKCPVVDNIHIFVKDFEDTSSRLGNIRPNMNIKKLDICCTYYTTACVQYICKKFPKVKDLRVEDYDFYEYVQDYNLPKASLNMLKKYALGMNKYYVFLEGQRTSWDFNGSRKTE
ncbi:hypothetical protein BD560DRAFT_423187 [Blakeslea trispora]|nr:hypothetical protein BD560DRAFT_423187 [Blakeslea trispora]